MSARVLVVGDAPQIRQLLVRVLELENQETVIAQEPAKTMPSLNSARIVAWGLLKCSRAARTREGHS